MGMAGALTTTAIHIWVDHGGWGMPACGLLGAHDCVPVSGVGRVNANKLCAMCLAAALQEEECNRLTRPPRARQIAAARS
jgi:hypothetical protein